MDRTQKPKDRTAEKAKKRLLDDVIDYLYWRAQQATSHWEHEDATLALRIFVNAKDGVTDPVRTAYYHVFGTNQQRVLQSRRSWEWEVAKAMEVWREDVEPTTGVGREAAGRGTLYQMPAEEKPSVEKPLPSVLKKAASGDA